MDKPQKDTFKTLLPHDKQKTLPILVTAIMKDMYETVKGAKSGKIMVISGPPGTGKTTSLFWLFQQFKNDPKYHILCHPVSGISKLMEIEFPSDKVPVLMTDLVAPKTILDVDIEMLWGIVTGNENVITVVAQPSLFPVYNTLYATNSSKWTKLFERAQKFFTCPFSQQEESSYLSSCGLSESDFATQIEFGKSVPKMLSYLSDGKENYEDFTMSFIKHECSTLIDLMNDRGTLIKWEDEVKLVMAVSSGLKITSVGLKREEACKLNLCQSFLITISDDDKAISLFKLDDIFLKDLVRTMWNYTCKYVRIDSKAVIGYHFESCITKHISPEMKLEIIKIKHTDNIFKYSESMDVIFKFPTIGYAESHENVQGSDILWKMLGSCKAVDYIGYSVHNGKKLCIAVQVSVQEANQKNKFEKAIRISDEFTKDMDGIVVIYINPLHTNFETNLKIVRDVTSGATRATQRFQNWYYGQPQQSENESIAGLKLQLESIFQSRLP